MPEEAVLSVAEMTCASCVAHVEKAARQVEGVQQVAVNLARGRAVVSYDPAATDPQTVATAITNSGYPARAETTAHANAEERRVAEHAAHAGAWLRRAVVAIVLWLPVELLHWAHAAGHHAAPMWGHWLALMTSTIAIIYVGSAFYRSAWKALRRGTSNMDTLIAMGATVAYVYSLIAFAGFLSGGWNTLPDLYFIESTGLLALISLGHWLEARARTAAGSAIRQLLELAPAVALKAASPFPGIPGEGRGEGEYEQTPVSALHAGDQILTRPGDRIPIDGVVIDGRSSVDESMLTGESMPILRQPGDTVIGGTLNLDGRLIVRVTRTGGETALAQIIKLVDQAQSSKPPVQKLADRIAAVFVPTVLMIALVTAIGWYVVGTMNHWDSARIWGELARSVCSVLIIACPCALGLAVPAALMVGTGRGARRGILIRDVDALQNAEKVSIVALDKTGTITRGKPAVREIIPYGNTSPEELLSLAASAELFSEHPAGKAIVAEARARGLKIVEPTAFTNEPGLGVVATVDGKRILPGNAELMQRHGITAFPAIPAAQTTVFVASEQPLGIITLADEIKPDSVEAIRRLHAIGLRTMLVTGDNESAAREIARQANIDDIRANVRPAGKADVIRDLQNRKSQIANCKSTVAMVGDGINDAPALAAADLGIAIGSGSDVAKEAGSIVLVGESLRGVPAAIMLSRATMRVIRQNLFFAFFYNVIAIPLAATGMLNPLIAAAAMALSDVTVIGNALRLRRTRID